MKTLSKRGRRALLSKVMRVNPLLFSIVRNEHYWEVMGDLNPCTCPIVAKWSPPPVRYRCVRKMLFKTCPHNKCNDR